jgi:UDP-N-acetylmuramoyl-tripeptide--D-alanyl-D-alanine ligase
VSWTLGELADFCGGALRGARDVAIDTVSTDTRALGPGALFVAVRGETYDGHDYAADALAHGAAAVLVSRASAAPAGAAAIVVGDTVAALGELARAHRARFAGPVIGITGSNGKTTTKELCASVLEAAGRRVRRTPGNLNNHIGLPLSVLALSPEDEVLVVEMGMNHEGEIDHLARIAEPTVGAITNIAPAHLGPLGSLEAIARAKGELYARIRPSGVAVVNADDPNCVAQSARFAGTKLRFATAADADLRARSVRSESGASRYTLECGAGSAEIRMGAPGLHLVEDGLCAAAAALASGALGADAIGAIRKGLESFTGVPGRAALRVSPDGLRLLDDTYNANPHSVARALETLAQLRAGQRAVAVLGDMLELGDQSEALHAEAGRKAAAVGVDVLVAVGALGREIARGAREAGLASTHECDDPDAAAELVRKHARAGDVVLVKASRGMRLERVVTRLMEPR